MQNEKLENLLRFPERASPVEYCRRVLVRASVGYRRMRGCPRTWKMEEFCVRNKKRCEANLDRR